jgi:hypothetical protein
MLKLAYELSTKFDIEEIEEYEQSYFFELVKKQVEDYQKKKLKEKSILPKKKIPFKNENKEESKHYDTLEDEEIENIL